MLTAGTKLGPYEIQSPIGAGGMGEVYKARDTRLERTVAIKVLNSALVASPDLKARFEREAKTISQLNHPHVCSLYDVGQEGELEFLVMEFLEGESLADRLRRGPLPLKELVSIGCDIAEALDRAHRAGIIHRDLKPGNVMLTKSGAKLLDFGLAKPAVMGAAAGSGSAPLLSAAMTMTSPNPQQSPLTQQGSLVGTVQYMSPEQIQGTEADARSDIFAFGAVLYEMATGKRPFEGKSQIKVASAILEDEPQPVSALVQTIPPALGRLVHTCLAKAPDERFQSALDVKLELQWISQTPATHAPSATRNRKRELIGWIVAAATVALAFAGYLITRPRAPLPISASIAAPAGIETNVAGRNGPPQISPDGTKLAFVGCRAGAATSATVAAACSIWVRPLASNIAHEVQGTEGGYYPFWSPDSRELAFFAAGKLKRVSADGGPVQVICDAEDARGGAWGRSGSIVFSPTRGSPVFRVPADGGTPTPVTRMTAASDQAQAGSDRWPYFLPDGEHFLYLDAPTASCGQRDVLRFASLDGRTQREVMTTCSTVAFADGRLLYWRDGNLVAQLFDPRQGILSGVPSVVADHVAFDTLFSRSAFSVSDNGAVVYIAGSELQPSQLLWHDRDGKVVGSLGEEAGYESIAIAPDGKRAAFSGLGGLWVLDERGTKTRLTSGVTFSPAWSGDGKRVFFAALRDGRYDIVSVSADGSGSEQTVLPASAMPGSIGAVQLSSSADGRFLTFVISSPTTKSDVYGLRLDGHNIPQPVVQSPANETMPSLSPDGAWLAYQSDQDGRSDIYVTAFPAGGARYQVSTAGGEKPIWSRDGRELFYRAPDFRLMAVSVTRSAGTLTFGAPRPLFVLQLRNLNGRAYDVSPDGRFLSNSSVSTQAHNIELLLNWTAELKK